MSMYHDNREMGNADRNAEWEFLENYIDLIGLCGGKYKMCLRDKVFYEDTLRALVRSGLNEIGYERGSGIVRF